MRPSFRIITAITVALCLANALTLEVYSQPRESDESSRTRITRSMLGGDGPRQVPAKPFLLKLDPRARALLDALSASKLVAWQTASSFANTVPGTVDLFLRLASGRSAEELNQIGVVAKLQVGRIVVAAVPVESIISIISHPAVEFVEAPQRLRVTNDSGRTAIQANLVHEGRNLPAPFTGRGVIVGVHDTGIDEMHPDFSDSSGTRIQYIWDMSDPSGLNAPGDLDPAFNFGREYKKTEIDASPSGIEQTDPEGHGTHVTGTAAGGGMMSDRYRGVAPGADIIMVKFSSDGVWETDAILACEYIFKRAKELGKPAVINLSLGSPSGPHDGTTLFEEALSDLTGPGNVIVASAGDHDDIHAGTDIVAGQHYESIVVPWGNSIDRIESDLWYSPGSISRVAIGAYRKAAGGRLELVGRSSYVEVGQHPVEETISIQNGTSIGQIRVDALTLTDPRNGSGNIQFELTRVTGTSLADYTWTLLIEGADEGRYDMWVTHGGLFASSAAGLKDVIEVVGDQNSTIVRPATGRKIISVGGVYSKNQWVNANGNDEHWTWMPVGSLMFYSGRGPTRDGRTVPDIVAPGAFVVSSWSGDASWQSANFLVHEPGYGAMQGTSMAAPHVTGTVALMLQANPNLDYTETVDILRISAGSNGLTGQLPNNEWGAGQLNAHAALQETVRRSGSSVGSEEKALRPTSFHLSENYPNPFNPSTSFRLEVPVVEHVTVAVYDQLGRRVGLLHEGSMHPGVHELRFDSGNLPTGVYFVRLEAGDAVTVRKATLIR